MSEILTHKTENYRKRSFGQGRAGGRGCCRGYDQSLGKWSTEQPGEIIMWLQILGLQPEEGAIALQKRQRTIPLRQNRGSHQQSQKYPASSDSDSHPPEATNPEQLSSGGFHHQVVQSCQHSSLPSASPASRGNPSPVYAKDTPVFDGEQAQAIFSGKTFLSTLLTPCG